MRKVEKEFGYAFTRTYCDTCGVRIFAGMMRGTDDNGQDICSDCRDVISGFSHFGKHVTWGNPL